VAALCAVLLLAACGSGSQQNPNEPHGYFPVRVSSSFPRSQQLAEHTRFVVKVTNAGNKTIPDVAVSVINPKNGDAAQSFGYLLPKPAQGQPLLASRSRPVWVVMQNPGPCKYSCKKLGPGGAATAYTDTWALGKLKPHQTATFAWKLEAVKAGSWKVEYQVAAGLNGYAKAELAGSGGHQKVSGTYSVKISTLVPKAHVKPDGQVVYTDSSPSDAHNRKHSR
jgi:hypothetical protein